MNGHAFMPGRRMLLAHRLLCAVGWGASLAALPFAPARVPTHWNIQGRPDDFMAPLPGLFLLPMVMLVFVVLAQVAPRVDPRAQSYAGWGNTYRYIQTGILAFLLLLHLVNVSAALGQDTNMNAVVTTLVGLLLIGIGNVLGKIRPNWFMGIRTPWTLSSPDVWTATHRFGGRLMVAIGVALVLAGLLLPPVMQATMVGVGAVGLAVLTMAYSYLAWRRLGGRRMNEARRRHVDG